MCKQVARIQQQVLDALKQAPQSGPVIQDAIVRLNSQLFDISMVSCVIPCSLLIIPLSYGTGETDDKDFGRG